MTRQTGVVSKWPIIAKKRLAKDLDFLNSFYYPLS